MSKEAVIIVDVQNDFCPGGSLAVKDGEKIIEPINRVSKAAREVGSLVVFTRDWHPKKTTHFKDYGGLWPEHCVQGTDGAAFHQDLVIDNKDIIVSKGMGDKEDAYSGFQARDDKGQLLNEILKSRGIERLIIAGLATEYCDKATILDGLNLGYQVDVLRDGIKGVNLQLGDDRKAMSEMIGAGARFISTTQAIDLLCGLRTRYFR